MKRSICVSGAGAGDRQEALWGFQSLVKLGEKGVSQSAAGLKVSYKPSLSLLMLFFLEAGVGVIFSSSLVQEVHVL